jgi:hypothetical protein
MAAKQIEARFRGEPCDRAADRRLGDAHGARRSGDRALFQHAQEHLDAANFHSGN